MTGATIDADAFLLAVADDPVAAFDVLGPRVPELAAMADCPQPANHHSEGDVWRHTRLALEMLVDLGAHIERFAGASLRAAERWPLGLPAPPTMTRSLAVMLHDVGKPPTRRGPAGAWTYHGHDAVGARMARDLIGRHRLVDAARRLDLVLDPDDVEWLIANHLFWLNTRIDEVTDAAVARRYTDDWARGDDLRVLSWADTLGSRGPDGRPHVELMVAAETRLHATRQRALRPPEAPAVRGDLVMDVLGLEPGPRVGAVLDWLAAQELRDDEALQALRTHAMHLRESPLDDLRED